MTENGGFEKDSYLSIENVELNSIDETHRKKYFEEKCHNNNQRKRQDDDLDTGYLSAPEESSRLVPSSRSKSSIRPFRYCVKNLPSNSGTGKKNITVLSLAAPDIRIGGGLRRRAPKIRSKFVN